MHAYAMHYPNTHIKAPEIAVWPVADKVFVSVGTVTVCTFLVWVFLGWFFFTVYLSKLQSNVIGCD